MYPKTKHFFTGKTIFFAVLAVILIFASGSVSANGNDPSVENVNPANGDTLHVNTIDFQCHVNDGGQILDELGLYVDGSTVPVETISSPMTGTYTFPDVPVANGPHTYYCAIYASGFFSSSDSWNFTVEMLCEECTYPECYGWCPPGLVCRGVGVLPAPPEGFCECVPDIITTTTIQETTTTIEETTTTIEETTTTIEETTTSIPAVPEFASLTVALMILLTTPAFAYLIVKRRAS